MTYSLSCDCTMVARLLLGNLGLLIWFWVIKREEQNSDVVWTVDTLSIALGTRWIWTITSFLTATQLLPCPDNKLRHVPIRSCFCLNHLSRTLFYCRHYVLSIPLPCIFYCSVELLYFICVKWIHACKQRCPGLVSTSIMGCQALFFWWKWFKLRCPPGLWRSNGHPFFKNFPFTPILTDKL